MGGLPEVIQDGVNSCLFELGNLAEAIEKSVSLLKNDELYQQMCLNAVKTATHRFSRMKIINEYEKLYLQ